jgi:cyclopropane fatty-acyl-phospholipid synthase-like methyltransferase
VQTEPTVVNCYDFFDRVFPECGMLDLTEGIYHDHPSTPYEQAQANQRDWLLDEIGCEAGSRILDIGCGNGTLLAAAEARGAKAIGITVSPPQVERCRRRGLDARLLDYRQMDDTWEGRFDALVANGSIEHFVQPRDVLAGRGDEIYRELFATCHRLIDPVSPSGRMATTVIHTHDDSPVPDHRDLLKGPWSFRWGTFGFHYAMVQRGFGGYYPAPGQLARAADPHFQLVEQVDGTDDYRLTSEACFRRVKRALVSWPTALRIWPRLVAYCCRHPRQGPTLALGLLVAESWQWQFRGAEPPTRLLRQVWQYRAA